MNARAGWMWVMLLRPVADPSGESDWAVASPDKGLSRRLAEEFGITHDIVSQRWMRAGKAAFVAAMRPDKRVERLKRLASGAVMLPSSNWQDT